MLSNKAKYGLKALIYLAGATGPLLAAEIARDNQIPRKFLDTILAELTKAGILSSKKGKGGGYQLARPADAIAVGQVIRIFDGPIAPIPCASRGAFRPCADCVDVEACAVRHVMVNVRDATALIVDRTSIAALRSQLALATPRPAGVVALPGWDSAPVAAE